jgi:hypothetical protein
VQAAGGRRAWGRALSRFEKSLGKETKAKTDKYPGTGVTGNQSCTKSDEDACRDKKMPAMTTPVLLLFNR